MYRAKTKSGGKWVCGVPVQIIIKGKYSERAAMVEYVSFAGEDDFSTSIGITEIDRNTLCVSMTSRDKYGRRIYSGDIIQTKSEAYTQKTLLVTYYENAFCVCIDNVDHPVPIDDMEQPHDMKDFVVIGNIYDNPELIKRKENEK